LWVSVENFYMWIFWGYLKLGVKSRP